MYFSVYQVIQYLKEAATTVRELDTALGEMRKVSDESVSSLKKFQQASFDIANTVGTTALEIQNSTADFMRLGYSLKEAGELAEDANIYANVGDMDIDEATEHMISSIQAWQSEFNSATEASTNIIDRYNKIGKIVA
jgi:TP901 family phage tail tape measure protein